MKPWKQLLLVAVSLAAPAVVFSQTGLTSLRGTITDPSGAVVVGAQVTVSNETVGFMPAESQIRADIMNFPRNLRPRGSRRPSTTSSKQSPSIRAIQSLTAGWLIVCLEWPGGASFHPSAALVPAECFDTTASHGEVGVSALCRGSRSLLHQVAVFSTRATSASVKAWLRASY